LEHKSRKASRREEHLPRLSRADRVAPQFHEEQNEQRGIDAGESAIGAHPGQTEPDRQRNRQRRRDDTSEEAGPDPSLASHPEAAERQHVPKEMIEAIMDPMS